MFSTALQKRYSTPFLPFVIALFSAPFALSLSRKGRIVTIGGGYRDLVALHRLDQRFRTVWIERISSCRIGRMVAVGGLFAAGCLLAFTDSNLTDNKRPGILAGPFIPIRSMVSN